jgi:hypothetical protein
MAGYSPRQVIRPVGSMRMKVWPGAGWCASRKHRRPPGRHPRPPCRVREERGAQVEAAHLRTGGGRVVDDHGEHGQSEPLKVALVGFEVGHLGPAVTADPFAEVQQALLHLVGPRHAEVATAA